MTKEIPTAQHEEQNYCELCGIDVPANIELKRFGKYFCSKEHLNEYVTNRQKNIGITGDKGDNSNTDNRHYHQREDDYQEEEPRRTRWFRGLGGGGGCC